MSTDKLLAEWFWVDRWVGSSAFGLPIAARGLYREMLSQAWRRQARLPNDHEQIRRLTGVTEKEWRVSWPLVKGYWQVDGDHLVNATQIEIYTEALDLIRKRSVAGRLGNEKRWQASQTPSQKPSQSDSQNASQNNGNGLAPPIAKPSPPISNLQSPVVLQDPDVHPKREIVVPATASLSLVSDPFTNQDTANRAAAFIERYQPLYQKHRKGARYAVRPARDYAAAVRLCTTWPDERLDKLAVIFLTTDHQFAEEGSRTIPQFLALASWCDGRLAEHDASNGHRS